MDGRAPPWGGERPFITSNLAALLNAVKKYPQDRQRDLERAVVGR